MDGKKQLQFVPYSSMINPAFWEVFSQYKLNELRLSTDPVQIKGLCSRRIVEGVSPNLSIHYDAFNDKQNCQPGEMVVCGTLMNANSVEEFKNSDKSELLKTVANQIWEAIISGEAEAQSHMLSTFLLYIYADLKKYHYYHWCAFPTFVYPTLVELVSGPLTLKERIKDEQLIDDFYRATKESEVELFFFTSVIESSNRIQVFPLSSYHQKVQEKAEDCEVWLGFSDSCSSPGYPGWALRNLLTLAAVRWGDIKNHTVIALRERISSESSSCKESLVFEIKIHDEKLTTSQMPRSLGWEKNEKGKMGPKFCNMLKTMEPSRIAESAVDLNLRLMKWRLDPILDLESIKNCRCLLIGAGTLGCNVARCLLGWGVQKITFVDGGKVSYSNPVRQSLFQFEDCVQGIPKAEAAATALKKIYPRIDATGHCLSVPMPGHTVGPSQVKQVTKDVSMLEKLIEEHHTVFLLTDSRESRWLPSLIGAAKKKIVLTAALGFDSYVVIRHGVYTMGESTPEESLGCYFCNDVVAPGDSTSDRSLDQQCTVTRPGMSFMAAGHIVEMLVDILQYPVRSKHEDPDIRVPHSIRYFLGRMSQLLTTSPAFKNCSACSSLVISAYLEDGCSFLFKVFESPSYLEEISGLKKLHQESQRMELMAISDSESEPEES